MEGTLVVMVDLRLCSMKRVCLRVGTENHGKSPTEASAPGLSHFGVTHPASEQKKDAVASCVSQRSTCRRLSIGSAAVGPWVFAYLHNRRAVAQNGLTTRRRAMAGVRSGFVLGELSGFGRTFQRGG